VRRPGQSLDALPSVDLLLVSHNHYDHMDLPTLRRIQTRWSPCVATGPGNARHLAKAGIRGYDVRLDQVTKNSDLGSAIGRRVVSLWTI
jgi:L-ascorbate metabolism protein UlaG (beta-lactamase superfamily)